MSEYNKKHQMQQYLHRVGLAPADLQQLHAIHVSGTKGKVHDNHCVVCNVEWVHCRDQSVQ